MTKISRRDFLVMAGGTLLLSCSEQSKPSSLRPRLLGPNATIGHRLRDGNFPMPTKTEKISTLIVGGGISGLSAGWWLNRNNYSDFKIVELESQVGGNARSGKNSVGEFPWGAHYLPLPGVDAQFVRLLLSDLDVLKGDVAAESPAYEEKMLVQAPDERLFIQGAWQDGLIPRVGIGAEAKLQIDHFEKLIQEWSEKKGADQKYVFTIPSDLGSQDQQFLSLDKITFAEWLNTQGFNTESIGAHASDMQALDMQALDWYVSYSLRDDFGVDHHQVSAWAGLHYFCCRRGFAANAEPRSVITSPQGNGWIVQRLHEMLRDKIQIQKTVVRVTIGVNQCVADVYDEATNSTTQFICDHLIWSAPSFILARLLQDFPKQSLPDYAPWLVANLTLQVPDESEFSAWDNVIYQGQGLGYVDATHQTLRFRRPERVVTYYHALNQKDHKAARRKLLETSADEWAKNIFSDLKIAHPQLESYCTQLDIWRWPHAMAIPAPGFKEKINALKNISHKHFTLAHSDLSGFSLFEEAQYWGVTAARKILVSQKINISIKKRRPN